MKTILLIDDDDLVNYLHKFHLSEVLPNQNIIVKSNAEAVLQDMQNGSYAPDIMFLDINMPRVTGWDFLNEYKKQSQPEDCIIYMVSASVNPKDKQLCDEDEYIEKFLQKPLNEVVLRTVFAELSQ